MHWDDYFIKMAQLTAEKSKDRSTKVGAVIVGPDNEVRSIGFNGFPRGIDDDLESRHERPEKYGWVVHAELNAILNAARVGIPLKGCRLYLNFEPIPCSDCCKAIIQAGIVEVLGPDIKFPGKGQQWEESLARSRKMMSEAGVKYCA